MFLWCLSLKIIYIIFLADIYKNLKIQDFVWNNHLKKCQNRFSLNWHNIKVVKTYWHRLTFLLCKIHGDEYSNFAIFHDFILYNEIYA